MLQAEKRRAKRVQEKEDTEKVAEATGIIMYMARPINFNNVIFVCRRWRNLEKRRKIDGRASRRRYVCYMKVEVLFMCVEVCYRAPSRKDL